jgi:TRAP transporter TAXI family solute receptor
MSRMCLNNLAAGLLAAAVLSPVAASAQSTIDVIAGTTSSRSSFFAYYATTAKLLSEANSPVRLTVSETGGIEENLVRMSKGEFNVGLMAMRPLNEAYNGVGKTWEGKPQKNQRLLYVFMIAPQAFMVRKDAGVNTVQDLNGKKWSPGHRGSGSEKATMQIMEVLGVKPDYYRGAMPDIVRAIKNGEIIGFSKGLPGPVLDATMLDIQTNHPIQIIGFSDSEVATLKKDFASLPHLKLSKELANMPTDQNSWAFVVAASALADLHDDAAYWLTKIAIEKREEIAKAFKAAAGTDPLEATLKEATVPLHPGAIRYFRERGKTIPEHLIPKG